jgi:glc operon protein GlcG
MTVSLINRRFHRLFEVALAILARCEEVGLDAAVTAVDSGGRPVVVLRTDLAPFITLEASRRKATTSACMLQDTKTISELVGSDPLVGEVLRSIDDVLAVPGGFPVYLDGTCIGGVGIAASHYSEDHAIGQYVMFAGDRQA